MASLYATTVCLLRLHRQVTLMVNSMKRSQRKLHQPPPVNTLPRTDELITRWKSSPAMNSLKRAEIECQIFHAVRATVVEVYTRGHFR